VAYERHRGWLEEVESTQMSKSYKMVLLLAMLERGSTHWAEPIRDVEAAPFFHRYLMERDYRRRLDFSNPRSRKLWSYDEAGVARLIREMPMTKWSGRSDGWVETDRGGTFRILINEPDSSVSTTLQHLTREVVEYRLHNYFERQTRSAASQGS
jgi:hypothetical protein